MTVHSGAGAGAGKGREVSRREARNGRKKEKMESPADIEGGNRWCA